MEKTSSEIEQTIENPLATRLFSLEEKMSKGQEVLDTAQSIANDFFQHIEQKQLLATEQENGLLSYMLLTWFKNDLQKETSDKLFYLTTQALNKGELLNRTMDRIRVMKQEMVAYFGHVGAEANYFLASTIDESPLAMKVIEREAKRMALRKQVELEKDGRTDAIVVPIKKNGRPGIWMSTKGIPYDPAKIELSEAA